jgi:hypothetical protein
MFELSEAAIVVINIVAIILSSVGLGINIHRIVSGY